MRLWGDGLADAEGIRSRIEKIEDAGVCEEALAEALALEKELIGNAGAAKLILPHPMAPSRFNKGCQEVLRHRPKALDAALKELRQETAEMFLDWERMGEAAGRFGLPVDVEREKALILALNDLSAACGAPNVAHDRLWMGHKLIARERFRVVADVLRLERELPALRRCLAKRRELERL